MKKHRVSAAQVDTLTKMRLSLAAFQTLVGEHGTAFDCNPTPSEEQRMHLQVCDGAMNVRSVSASAEQVFNSLDTKYRMVWTSDLTALTSAVKGLCPPWAEASKDTMMTDKKTMKLMLDLKPDDASKIGPLCTEMKEQLDVISTMRGGRLVDPAVYQAAESMQKHGSATVIYRAVIWATEKDFPLKDIPAEAAVAAELFLAKVKNKGVVLTDPMKEILQKWKTGDQYREAAAALAEATRAAGEPAGAGASDGSSSSSSSSR